MDVEIVYVDGCPNVDLARRRVEEAARHVGIDAVVRERVVSSVAEAEATRMRGSPTVLVAGTDVAAGGTSSLSCRLYVTAQGYEGAPTVEEIAAALAGAARPPPGAAGALRSAEAPMES